MDPDARDFSPELRTRDRSPTPVPGGDGRCGLEDATRDLARGGSGKVEKRRREDGGGMPREKRRRERDTIPGGNSESDDGSGPIIGSDADASPVAGNGDNGPTIPARPLRLVYLDENGKLMMDPEAVAALQLVKGPVGVVSVFGRARQGKSSVLNQLLGHRNGFRVASTFQPCTKGLWMWSTPLKKTAPDGVGCSILLLDTEGTDSCEQMGNSSIPIFSLLVLLSSMLICNQRGGERSIDALDCLSQAIEMTKHLRGRASGGKSIASELGQSSPVFVWLLRDFCEDLTETTPRDYLDLALGPVQGGGRDASAKNALRESVRARFPDRECFTLVRPVSNEKDLHRLDQLPESKFRPEFRSGLNSLREFVLDRTSPILFGGSTMTGPMLAELTQSFLDAINSGTVPAISLSQQSVEEAEYPRPDNSSLDGKRKFEELRLRKRELDEVRARNAELRALIEEKKQMLAKAKEESHLAAQLRKKAHRALQDAKGALRVYLRICPIAIDGDRVEPKEKESVVTLVDDDVVNLEGSYRFDKIFSDKSSQSEIFNELYDLVQSAIDGNKVCIFAYGQSGTGKTYTMIGELKMDNDNVNVNAGLILRALKVIFDQTKDEEYVIKLCVSEIYNNTNKNLIDRVILEDLDMAIKILRRANRKRASNDTKLNNRSSRSHCFFHIEIHSPANMVSEVCFVDLAGSERYDISASNSVCKETIAIAESLFHLRQFLESFATNKTIQRSDMKDTLIAELVPYLRAGSKTAIFATLSQERRRMKESKRTLEFVKSIKSLNLDDD